VQLPVELGADVNVRNDRPQAPVHVAAFVRYVEGVEFPLKHAAKINARDNGGKTPLAVALQPTPMQSFFALLGARVSAEEAEEERNRRKGENLLRANGGLL